MDIYDLKNGSKLLTLNKDIDICSFYICVGVGSIYESMHEKGVAHYLEHLLFKGSTKYNGLNAIAKNLDSFGADFNAYTTKDVTCYFCTVSKLHINKAINILLDMVYNPILDRNDFLRERTVIIEEINRTHDNPKFDLEERIYELIYGKNSQYGYPIPGFIKDIEKIEYNDLKKFYEKYYVSKNMKYIIVGNFNNNITNIFNKYTKKGEILYPKINIKPKSIVKVFTKPNMKQIQIYFCWPICKYENNDKYGLHMLANILASGMSSRLFIELREKRGMSYNIYAYTSYYLHTGLFTISTAIDDERVLNDGNKEGGLKIIYDNVTKLKTTLLKDIELNKQKTYLQGQNLIKYHKTEYLAQHLGEELFYKDKKVTGVENIMGNYNNISSHILMELAKKYLSDDKMSIILMGNIKQQDINSFNY